MVWLTRWAVVLALAVVVGACGNDTDDLVGTWTGANAKGPITLVIDADDTFSLTIDHEGVDDGGEQRETGTLRRAKDGTHLVVSDLETVARLPPFPRVFPVLFASRVRCDGESLLLERPRFPRVGADVWVQVARLKREDG